MEGLLLVYNISPVAWQTAQCSLNSDSPKLMAEDFCANTSETSNPNTARTLSPSTIFFMASLPPFLLTYIWKLYHVPQSLSKYSCFFQGQAPAHPPPPGFPFTTSPASYCSLFLLTASAASAEYQVTNQTAVLIVLHPFSRT